MQKPKLSIVIPTYNEELRIEESIHRIVNFMNTQGYRYEIVISDDGSTDETKNIVKKYQEEYENLVLLENPHKGKAPSLISGVYSTRGDFTLFTDVDLSVGIEELPKLLNWVENQEYDIAIASREGKGAKRINEPLPRHIMGRVFNILVQIVILPGINDTQCGFKLFKSDAIKKIFTKTLLYSASDPEIKGGKVSGFDVEMLFVARLLGYRIKEVPVLWTYGEQSKVHKLKDSYYNAKDVFRVRLNKLKGKYSI